MGMRSGRCRWVGAGHGQGETGGHSSGDPVQAVCRHRDGVSRLHHLAGLVVGVAALTVAALPPATVVTGASG